MNKWKSDLEGYLDAVDQHLKDNVAFKYADFYRDFFQFDKIEAYQWNDIQKLGAHLHCFQSLAIARGNALGKPNHDIEHYRRSFAYLAHGDDDVATRIDRFVTDHRYKLYGFGPSAVSEICAYLFADQVFMRNSRDLWAAERYALTPRYERGSTFGQKLITFGKALQPLVHDYQKTIGRRTNLALNLEVDQFISYIYQREAQELPETTVQKEYWVIGTGHDGTQWKEFRDGAYVGVGFFGLGDLRAYTNRESIAEALRAQDGLAGSRKNDSLAAWQFTHVMKPGDIVIAKQGVRRIFGVGTVTSDYHYSDQDILYRNLHAVKWHVTGDWQLPEDRGVATKTLTNVTKYDTWIDLVMKTTGMNEAPEPPESSDLMPGDPLPYPITEALEDVFIPGDYFLEILAQLKLKQNIVLQGPPGVGKTFVAKRLAYALMGMKDPTRIEMIQFHQSYSYEDFVQGLRPDSEGKFKLQDGVFYRFCKKAADDEDRPYVFIIDEINRGNLSRILGELMMLIEADKRGPAWAVFLTYGGDGDSFHVPANVYLVGTMNTADRSLAMVDYALRRRFSFLTLDPAYGTEGFRVHLETNGVPDTLIAKINARLLHLNELIAGDAKCLGSGFRIGHSYFCPRGGDEPTEDWYRRVVKYEIAPLLSEYWFDDDGKVSQKREELLAP